MDISKNIEMNFCDIFAMHKIIEDCTVYTELVRDTGRVCEYRYSGNNQGSVERFAKKKFDGIDKYRSPSLSSSQPYNGGYACILKIYGLD